MGDVKDCCPDFPKLHQKGLYLIFCKRWTPFFEGKQRRAPLGTIFAQIFRDLPRYLRFVWIFRDFSQNFWDFPHIFRDFSRIFNKSKLLGVRLHPLHPHLLHKGRTQGEGFGFNPPPLSIIFYKTLLPTQRRLIVFAYFLLVNLSA